jgi:exo-beta-1,3-glucanase (GH17 family)
MNRKQIQDVAKMRFPEIVKILTSTVSVLGYQELVYGDQISETDYKRIADVEADVERVLNFIKWLKEYADLNDLQPIFSDTGVLDTEELVYHVSNYSSDNIVVRVDTLIERMEIEDLLKNYYDKK